MSSLRSILIMFWTFQQIRNYQPDNLPVKYCSETHDTVSIVRTILSGFFGGKGWIWTPGDAQELFPSTLVLIPGSLQETM